MWLEVTPLVLHNNLRLCFSSSQQGRLLEGHCDTSKTHLLLIVYQSKTYARQNMIPHWLVLSAWQCAMRNHWHLVYSHVLHCPSAGYSVRISSHSITANYCCCKRANTAPDNPLFLPDVLNCRTCKSACQWDFMTGCNKKHIVYQPDSTNIFSLS